MAYWLFKTEPGSYSWQDLLSGKKKTTSWDGVRNYQARNLMKEMKVGDLGFFYHSVAKPLSIQGIVRVVKEAYPDHTAFDPKSKYYDPKSSPENPRWFMVDVQAASEFDPVITREELQQIEKLADMMLLQRGSRLSVQPVKESEWKIILSLAEEEKRVNPI